MMMGRGRYDHIMIRSRYVFNCFECAVWLIMINVTQETSMEEACVSSIQSECGLL